MARPTLEPALSVEGSLVGRLRALAAGDGVAVIDERGSFGYGELWAEASALAASLGGPLEGKPVALLAPPGRCWVTAFFGILLAGGVVLPLSPLHPEAELRYFVADSGARLALVDLDAFGERASWLEPARVVRLERRSDDAPLAEARGSEHPLKRPSKPAAVEGGRSPSVHVRTAREPGPDGAGFDVRALLRPDRIEGDHCPRLQSGVHPSTDEGALLLYTSGTTGKPKGALLTQGNLLAQTAVLAQAWGMSSADRLVHVLPLHHLHGVVVSLLTTLQAGGTVCMMQRFEAAAVWEALAGATVFMGVPTMYHRLLEAFDGASGEVRARWGAAAKALRLAASGSAALPVAVAERWAAVTGLPPLERYGMTEIGMATSNPLEGERRPGTVGRPLPGVGLRCVAEGGGEAAPGEAGEIWVRGPSVFAGYVGRDEATLASFTGAWFRTGDVAVIEAGGYVRLLGRASVDILKSAGYKLSAVEIEEALRAHGSVDDAAVVGLPDEALGERVVACIVARPDVAAAGLGVELAAHCRARLAPYKVPRTFVVVGELPRNALGKVQKPELVRRLLAATSPEEMP